MSYIARLGVILGLNSAEFTKGLDEAVKKTKDFERNQKQALKNAQNAAQEMSSTFAIAAGAAGALAAGFAAVAQKADGIMDVAKAFDVTVESLLSTKAALQASGGEADNYTTLMSKLASVQEDAKNGSDGLRESFKKLGISGKDVDNLNLNDLFKLVAQQLSQVEDAGKRAAVAQDLLGKAAKGVDWRDFVANYKEVANPELANAIRDNAQAWDNIEKSMKAISMIVQQLVQPFAIVFNYAFDLLKIWNEIKEGADVEVDWGAAMGGMPGEEGATTIHKGKGKPKAVGKPTIANAPRAGSYAIATQGEEKVRSEIIKVNQEYQKRLSLLNDSIDMQSRELSLIMQKYNMSSTDYELAKKTLDLNNQILKLEADKAREIKSAQAEYEAQSDKDKNKKLLNQKIKQIEEYYKIAIPAQKELNAITLSALEKDLSLKNKYIYQDLVVQKAKETEAIELNYSAQMELLKLESQAYKLKSNDYNLLKMRIDGAQQLAEIENKYAEKRKDLQVEYERTSGSARDRELFEEKLANLDKLQRLETFSTDVINSTREDNFIKEVERQKSWSAGWEEAFKQYQETAERVSNRGKEAFNMTVNSMESALKNFVETGKLDFGDLIKTIIRQLLVAEAVAQGTALFKMGLSSVMSSFSGGGPSAAGFLMTGKASGGAINGPSLVGENGPELFVPNSAGTIIPNGSWQQMANSGGGGMTINGPYIANLSTIDSKSFEQRIYESNKAVWSAGKYAEKSLMASGGRT